MPSIEDNNADRNDEGVDRFYLDCSSSLLMSSVNPSPILTHATLKFFLTQLRTDTNELAYHIGIQVAVNTRGCGQMPSNPGAYWCNLTIL